jgi:hypothetical protein
MHPDDPRTRTITPHHSQQEQHSSGSDQGPRVQFYWSSHSMGTRSPLLATLVGAGVLIMGATALFALFSVALPILIGLSVLGLLFRRPAAAVPPPSDEPLREIEVTAKRVD